MFKSLGRSRPLYVALSMHPHHHHGEAFSQYHWSLVVGPSIETPLSKGTRYHVVYARVGNEYLPRIEKDRISLGIGSSLVVRAKIGVLTRIQDLERLITSIATHDLLEPGCEAWVARVAMALHSRRGLMHKQPLEWYMVRAWVLAMAEDAGRGYKTDMGYNRVVDLAKRVRSLPDQRYFSMRAVAAEADKFADDVSMALSLTSTETLV